MLANITLANADWWTAIDALNAFAPPDGSLATLIEGEVPPRDTDPGGTTTILGLTDQAQDSLILRLSWTPGPIFNAKVVASSVQQQAIGQAT